MNTEHQKLSRLENLSTTHRDMDSTPNNAWKSKGLAAILATNKLISVNLRNRSHRGDEPYMVKVPCMALKLKVTSRVRRAIFNVRLYQGQI